jgi:predicted alpha/beta superfamily hydrolase
MKPIVIACLLFFASMQLNAQEKAPFVQKPFVLGQVVELQSKLLQEKRVLNIYFPAGYHANDTTRYPVIYLLDGSADEDFIHIAGLVQFLTFPWVQSMPNSIVVGISNVDRRRDFTFPTRIAKDQADFPTTGHSQAFIEFLEKELQPYIDSSFQTTSSRTIIGQSLGGLVATQILFTKPQLFSKYIIVSPSLWWDNESLLLKGPDTQNPAYKNPVFVYLAVGKEGKRMEGDVKRLAQILRTMPGKNISVGFDFYPNENHASILHLAAYKGLEAVNRVRKK